MTRVFHTKFLVPLLSALRDGDLQGLRARLLRSHLSSCEFCKQAYYELDVQARALSSMQTECAALDTERGFAELMKALRVPAKRAEAKSTNPVQKVVATWIHHLRLHPIGYGTAVALSCTLVFAYVAWTGKRAPSPDVLVQKGQDRLLETTAHYERTLVELKSLSLHAGEAEVATQTDASRAAFLAAPADLQAQRQLAEAYRQHIASLHRGMKQKSRLRMQEMAILAEGPGPAP